MRLMQLLKWGALAVATAMVVAAGCHNGGPTPASSAANAGPAGLQTASAPDFELKEIHGGSFHLGAARGKHPVLINFFATWCPGCVMEYPHLEALYEKYRAQGLEVVSISNEPAGQLNAFAAAKGATFAVLSDPTGSVSARYAVDAIPANVLVDRDGHVVTAVVGYSEEEFDGRLARVVPTLLASAP